MSKKTVYSLCGMCTVRCPIAVDVENDEVTFIQGNPKSGLKGALCARGAAGYALSQDHERPQKPMIRDGARGEGKWREVSWDEALTYVADKIKGLQDQYGKETILWSDRGGPFVDLNQAFCKAIGTPNYCNHDVACARNVQHAAKSTMGKGRKEVFYDYTAAKHIVFQSRNVFEAINVGEVNQVLDGMEKGAKMTCIDIRANVTASKADNFFMIRPGTDYAFNLGVINELLAKDYYDKEFAAMHINGLDKLKSFVEPYTIEWAAKECNVSADAMRNFVKELAEAAPAVVWYAGWMTARYKDSFYMSRTIYLINALLGSIGSPGGLPFVNTPKEYGNKGLNKLAALFDKPEAKRADGAGWRLKHIDAGPGLVDQAYDVMESGDPYPLKGYICFRHDPLMAHNDPEATKKQWDNLDLLVSITFTWSETAWYSDVVLPMSPYLERESILQGKSGGKPSFWRRQRVLTPRYDTKADWEILCGIADKMGIEKFAFKSIEDIWNYQLEGTGVSISDFDAKGSVGRGDKKLYRDRSELTFGTPSGKIEVVSDKWEDMGIKSLKPYESPENPGSKFRVAFGRCGLHTQGHTVNNPLLHEQMPVNPVWINTARAKDMGLADGDAIEVFNGPATFTSVAKVTDFVHPEAAFMVHGFGHHLAPETRTKGEGVADNELMFGKVRDEAGGALAMQECFVEIRKA